MVRVVPSGDCWVKGGGRRAAVLPLGPRPEEEKRGGTRSLLVVCWCQSPWAVQLEQVSW